MAELVRAVSFTRKELQGLISVAAAQELEALTADAGSLEFNRDESEPDGTISRTPIVRFGEQLIVGAPCGLLGALRHRIISLLSEYGLRDELARHYREAVFDTVREALVWLESRPIPRPLTPVGPPMVDALFSLDRDKALHVLVVTDSLDGYDETLPYGHWEEDLSEAIESRLIEVDYEILLNHPAPNALLHLIVLQGLGRTHFAGLGEPAPPARSPHLMMSAADLESIAMLEAGDPLALWKYARAGEEIRNRTRVIQMNELDEFGLYRSHRHSYYISDDAPPTLLQIVPGFALPLIEELRDRLDIHAALSADGNSILEVANRHNDREIPIAYPWKHFGEAPSVLCEAFKFSVWILAPDEAAKGASRSLYADFGDLVAYWLWQLRPGMDSFGSSISQQVESVTIRLRIQDPDVWMGSTLPTSEAIAYVCEIVSRDELKLTIEAAAIAGLARPDNLGERDLVRTVLRTLRELAHAFGLNGEEIETEASVERLLDRFAPLGQKKKLVLITPSHEPEFRRPARPDYRTVQEADIEELLDQLGPALMARTELPVGNIPSDARVSVLNEAVAYLFEKLDRLVQTLSPKGLLEWLVEHNEAAIAHQALEQFSFPTRIACFGLQKRIMDRIRSDLSLSAETATSLRFLIEYIAARPPRGIRSMTLELLDRLTALAAEIINKGQMSDAIWFGLGDHGLSFLPSGRLGTERTGAFETGKERFLDLRATNEIARAAERYADHWRAHGDVVEPPELGDLDTAATDEFGVSLQGLMNFLFAAVNIGEDISAESKVLPLDDFLERLASQLPEAHHTVKPAFDFFALHPRVDYFNPPAPAMREDVYPWRFNRAISFVRRPFIVRPTDTGDEVVWGIRHTIAAGKYLVLGLCGEARLKARTPAMKRVITSIRERDNQAFNDAVANFLEEQPDLVVRRRVDKIAGRRIERSSGQSAGDIDVFVAARRVRRILAIETKNLSIARTPREMANEMQELFGTGRARRSTVEKHADRIRWIEGHLSETLSWLNLSDPRPTRWRVEPLIVVDTETMASHVVPTSIRVISFPELRRDIGALVGGSRRP